MFSFYIRNGGGFILFLPLIRPRVGAHHRRVLTISLTSLEFSVLEIHIAFLHQLRAWFTFFNQTRPPSHLDFVRRLFSVRLIDALTTIATFQCVRTPQLLVLI